MNYDRDGEALVHDRPVGGGTFRLRAEAIHQERTGVHARIAILYEGVALSWSTFNIERDEDRVRLANSAHKHLNGQAKDYPAAYLKQDLDDFCYGLWEASLGDRESEATHGSLERRPVRHVLTPYIVEDGGTILFSHPGKGKSWLTMLWAVSIDAGDAIPPARRLWPVRQRRVLYINLERGRERVEDRLGDVNAALGLPRDRPLQMMHQRGRSLQDVVGAARASIRKHGLEHTILDSISRAGMGDLTENNPVNKIVDTLNGLTPDWTGIAHAPRNSDEHLYGSVHFEAGADVVVRLLSQQEDGGPLGVGLQITKKTDGAKQQGIAIWALEFDQAGLSGIRHAHRGEFPDVESGRKLKNWELLRDYVAGLPTGCATATEAALETGIRRDEISRLFSNDPHFRLQRQEGRERFYGVIYPDE